MSDELHRGYTPANASIASGSGQSATARRLKQWISQPMVEDYSLRYAPASFRKWSEFTIAMTALGGIAYLADFAIGASIFLSYGFTSALWAILLAAVVIFVTGLPIAYYSARYNLDMDLLTRGAGFGYLGSTWTSLIYASFCFIFFALEGAIMAQGLLLFFGIPLVIGYLICSLIFIPLVLFGMTLLSRLQVWTQPIWLTLLVLPFIVVAIKDPGAYARWTSFVGNSPHGSGFNILDVGLGAGIALSLIAQIGEQVDYLRFMPAKTARNSGKWWAAVVSAGPGWVVVGALKQLGGGFLLSLIFGAMGAALVVEPIQQFLHGYELLFPSAFVALSVATLFVVISQIKINVTNAYSGSLSWSNFFSRILHRHPGRAVWLVLHIAIAIALMEFNVFHILNSILGFYSNVAIAWIGAVVADLVINKPLLKISPAHIEFKRSNLYNFNPVGFGSMLIASALSIVAFFGFLGPVLQAFSPFLALVVAFVLSPIIAVLTRGKYYLARTVDTSVADHGLAPIKTLACSSCGGSYEEPDMSGCPFHKGHVCSLCCTLENSCDDMCKSAEYREMKLVPLEKKAA
jgi:purine-cytosine permease-like protein